MSIFIDDNTTRKNIVTLLKKNGGMTIDELSKQVNITPMGVRQHLHALEKRGIVSYAAKKHGIGRPGFTYILTDASEMMFPKSYDSFALDMLRDIEKNEGREKVEKIFTWRRERIYKARKEALADKKDVHEIVQALRDILISEGYYVELARNNGSYHLMQYNCPITRIAHEYTEACRQELLLYKDLINENVRRTHVMSEGGTTCLYIIPIY